MSLYYTIIVLATIILLLLWLSGFILRVYLRLTVGRCTCNTYLFGKTALITGGNSGLGYHTARTLAGRGCRVIIADKDNCNQTKRKIIEETGNHNIVTKYFDLSSLNSVRQLAKDINESEKRLDILINNAGTSGLGNTYTEDGLHKGMQVNHFGSFLLTHLLIELMKQSAPSKIIFVSSWLAFTNNLSLHNLNFSKNKLASWWTELMVYGNAKLCNIITAKELSTKLRGTGVTANSLHPGLVYTPIFATYANNCSVNIIQKWFFEHIILKYFAKVRSPKLHIRSRKAPAPDGFVAHSSKLDSLSNSPFLVQWSYGKINKILLQKDEPLSLANIKKGIASLFQFQILDQEINETDSSGHCTVTYTSKSPNLFTKSKTSCMSSDLPYITNPELILSAKVQSERIGNYEMDVENKYIKSVKFEEIHTIFTAAKEDVGSKVEAYQSLTLAEQLNSELLSGTLFEEVVDKISNKQNIIFTQESLLTEREILPAEDAKTFQNTVNEYRANLKTNVMGTLISAKVIARLISVGRLSSKEDIAKTLGSKKNQAILHQLYDILGYVQTQASHEAAMKKLHFDDKKKEELSERYLWALSMSSQPNPDIIADLLNRYSKSSNFLAKVKETLLLTIGAMTYRLSNLPSFNNNFKIYHNVEEAILHGLEFAKGDDRYMYLRAMKNLKSPNTIPKLIHITRIGSDKEQVLAWKAIRSFNPTHWNNDVLQAAVTTFFQLDKKHDSSSRTLAIDIILESTPTDTRLRNLLYFLLSECKSFEVQQYLVQRLNMIGEENEEFKMRIEKIIKSDSRLNNYAVLAQKGLSTALTRSFLQSASSNGSLITIQEIQSGIVKRGIVNIMMKKNEVSQEIFSLGIFSGGLSSFISSDSDGADSDEIATAGIELTVLGTQIRPFIFFSGQGELMGHVWSGTASEKTTAYQALAMLHDHQEYLRLGPGFIAELDLKGATSFDLSGKIEISLWNRNAVSLVEKSAGIIILGFIRVDTSFVRSQVEFSVSIEPKLNLQTDIDFYSNVSLCMRLSQPDFIFRQNIFKIERIPGSKHRLRKVKYKKYAVHGKTYSLNKKNNEMCNVVFK